MRRKLAQAQGIGLGTDISKHLPVLEPVFRHVMAHSADQDGDEQGPTNDSLGDRNSGISQQEFVGLLSLVNLRQRAWTRSFRLGLTGPCSS